MPSMGRWNIERWAGSRGRNVMVCSTLFFRAVLAILCHEYVERVQQRAVIYLCLRNVTPFHRQLKVILDDFPQDLET